MNGNSELFTREDIVDAEWRIVNDILGNVTPLYSYAPGSWGPNEAEQLVGDDGPWLNPKPPESHLMPPGHEIVFLFDVDDTLLDNDAVKADLGQQVLDNFGQGGERPLLGDLRGAARQARLRRLPRHARALPAGALGRAARLAACPTG